MFDVGYVYKNKKTGIQFIPMACDNSDQGGILSFGYFLTDKKDDDVILVEGELKLKKKELEDWEITYKYF